jgi:hypothetical protein
LDVLVGMLNELWGTVRVESPVFGGEGQVADGNKNAAMRAAY